MFSGSRKTDQRHELGSLVGTFYDVTKGGIPVWFFLEYFVNSLGTVAT